MPWDHAKTIPILGLRYPLWQNTFKLSIVWVDSNQLNVQRQQWSPVSDSEPLLS